MKAVDNLQKFYLSNFSVTEHFGGALNMPAGEGWSSSDLSSAYDMFYYISEGRCTFVIDGEEFEGVPGRTLYVPAGTIYSYFNDKTDRFGVYWLYLNIYPNNINMMNMLELPYYVDAPVMKVFFETFLDDGKGQKIIDKLTVKSCFFQMLSKYMTAASLEKVSVAAIQNENLRRIIDYIDKNIYKNPSNEELAKICYLHPNNFIRFFKKEMGNTPAKYIKLKKMELAKKLIEETDLPFNEIMYRVGYDDAAHFSKSFKGIYGNVPQVYRKKACDEKKKESKKQKER